MTMQRTYVMAGNGAERERVRLECLERLLDPVTVGLLDGTGVGRGWRCLEVGAGAGSIAGWLGRRVGQDGLVDAVDVDVRFLDDLVPPVRAVKGDIGVVAVAPPYRLIHARAVLGHLPHRGVVLARLAGLLEPGGFLVIEEVAAGWDGSALLHAVADDTCVNEAVRMVRVLVEQAGGDVTGFPMRLPLLIEELGLDVEEVVARMPWIRGGDSGGSTLMVETLEYLRPAMLASGTLDEAGLSRVMAWANEPASVVPGPLVVSVCARRAT